MVRFSGLFLILFLSAPAGALESNLTGLFSYERMQYLTGLGSGTRTYDDILYFSPEWDVKFNRKTKMHFKPSLRANLSTKESPEDLFFNVREAFVEVKTYPLRTRLGMNNHNWGVLDVYSTADNVNGRTLFNPFFSERIGVPTVDLQYESSSFQFQVLYIPKQARTIMPSRDSRWLPRKSLTDATVFPEGVVLQPDAFNYTYLPYEDLDNSLKNNFGARLTSQFNSLDIGLSFFQGSGINPQVVPDVDTVPVTPGPPPIVQAQPDIDLRTLYFRQNIYALTVVRTFKKFIFRAESTYSDTLKKDPNIPEYYWQSGMGIEVPWDHKGWEYTGFFNIYHGDSKNSSSNLVNSSSRLFDKASILGLKISKSMQKSIIMSWMHDYESSGHFFHLSYESRWNKRIKWAIDFDMIEGKQPSILTTFRDNDRAVFRLTYTW